MAERSWPKVVRWFPLLWFLSRLRVIGLKGPLGYPDQCPLRLPLPTVLSSVSEPPFLAYCCLDFAFGLALTRVLAFWRSLGEGFRMGLGISRVAWWFFKTELCWEVLRLDFFEGSGCFAFKEGWSWVGRSIPTSLDPGLNSSRVSP